MSSVYPLVSVNLDLKKSSELSFPFSDFGFLYGYGLFESIRIQNGQPVLLKEHIARLKRGSIILDIPFTYEVEQLSISVYKLIKENNVENSILNMYLTPGDRGTDPAKLEIKAPFFLMVLRDRPEYDRDQKVSLDVRQESFQKTQLDRFKTLSWMKNVLEKNLGSTDHVLLYDKDQIVMEAANANVFFVKGEVLITPKSNVVLNGITRQYLIDHAKDLGLEVRMQEVFLDDLYEFDEIFLTNSLRGVIQIGETTDFPGLSSKNITKLVQDKYFQLTTPSVYSR
jgi:branched-subunit amino acid aminotransferase/4-amino-4-deoxychorismate lyase